MDPLERAGRISWYHTLELAPGHVTKGLVDVRPVARHYGLPESLEGMRCLDVGTWDGFWAFEMERRGASEVVGLDIDDELELDWPPRRRPAVPSGGPRGAGFELAKEVYGSRAERISRSLYRARPEDLGTFDLIVCGSVLIHMRDQLLALERLAGLCRGKLILAEEYDPLSGLAPFPVSRYMADRERAVVFWLPSARTWKRMLWTAGFDRVERHGRFRLPSPEGWSVRHVVLHATRA